MRIGIIGAMDEEIELMLKSFDDFQSETIATIFFHQGKIEDKEVVLCKSGVGKVNASVATQILIDRFQVEKIIFTGVAGGVHPELNIGDVVISNECQQHDIDASPLGFPKGEIPFHQRSIFLADPTLIKIALAASKEVISGNTVVGKILSGDQFIASREQVRMLYESYNGYCVEMEGAAVAQVCDLNHIPFVIIRTLSDKADGSAHVNFGEFVQMAAEISNKIVHKMLARL